MKEIHYFLDSITVQGLSDNTVQSYKRDLEKFSQFLEEQKVTRLQDVGSYNDGTVSSEIEKR